MLTAKIFENGRSQAVRLPKECRFSCDEVSCNRIGEAVILMPKDNQWAGLKAGLDLFTEDFMAAGREFRDVQDRENL